MSSKQGGKGGGGAKAKKPAKAAGGGGGGGAEKTEHVLQAVVIADSFQDMFRPFSLETPRCLLPIANTPLIEYTLHFLAMNLVQEVFIYCGAHHEQVEAYIQNSPLWGPQGFGSQFSSLEFIRVSDANSIGDFLRDLDKRGLIGGDFILVHGDLVSNVFLEPILEKHRARREANRDACMTMVLRHAGEGEHRTKAKGVEPVFVLDSKTGQCLHYEETNPLQSEHYTILDPDLLEKHNEVDIRTDVIDPGIDICTPSVLALWSESFDYELPRKNFLHGVLKDWELNGKIIHAEILEHGYAARASNLQMYDSVSRDILGSWTDPFTPSSNLLHDQTYKRDVRGGSVLEEGVGIGRKCEILRSVVGSGTTLGTGSTVLNSTIGRRCKIGDNVKIEDSYIWDDTTILDGTTVSRSILASSVTVGKNCRVPDGSLLSFGIQLGDGISLAAEPPAAISLLSPNGSSITTDKSVVGPGGKGAPYKETFGDDDDDDSVDAAALRLQKSLIYSLAGLNLSTSSISTFNSDDDDDDDDVSSQAPSFQASDMATSRSRLSSFASDDSAATKLKSENFHNTAVHGLVDALRADSDADFDSAKLEFMGLRLGNNASDQSVQRAVAAAFARRAAELLAAEHGSLAPTKAAELALTARKGAAEFIQEIGVGGDEVKEQVNFTLALQKALLAVRGLEPARAGVLLSAMLQQLYSRDVLEEDAIVTWWGDKRAAEGDSMNTAREECRKLVEWLENAEEEDSDEDEEEEEEEDDDDDEEED